MNFIEALTAQETKRTKEQSSQVAAERADSLRRQAEIVSTKLESMLAYQGEEFRHFKVEADFSQGSASIDGLVFVVDERGNLRVQVKCQEPDCDHVVLSLVNGFDDILRASRLQTQCGECEAKTQYQVAVEPTVGERLQQLMSEVVEQVLRQRD